MPTLHKNHPLLRAAYWIEGGAPPETSACQVGLRLLGWIPLGLMMGAIIVVLSPVLLAEWLGSKLAAKSNPKQHRRKPNRAARFCPWKIRVVGARSASKCENAKCACHDAPQRVPRWGWIELFHCPQCGKAREYAPCRGLQRPCFTCEANGLAPPEEVEW